MSDLSDRRLTLGSLIRVFRWKILLTWFLTLVETALATLVPLFIGFAIDGLLDGAFTHFINLGLILFVLVLIASGRRIYDTRAYGTMQVELAAELARRNSGLTVSALSARVHMARELTTFLEENAPHLMTSALRLVVSVVVLAFYDWVLAAVAVSAGLLVLGVYGLFHRRFFRLNRALNTQSEREVSLLEKRNPASFLQHLRSLRRFQVTLSDTEAIVYGLIFLVLLGVVMFNLAYTAVVLGASAGAIFSIVTYSWEFVEGSVSMPEALQDWSRLSEIINRINRPA